MSRTEAAVLVRRIMDADRTPEEEADGWLGMLHRAMSCPTIREAIQTLVGRPGSRIITTSGGF